MTPALVLTAGLATRLRPLSLVRAKAALPVAGEALARRILRWLSGEGVREAVLNLHHLPHTLTSLVGDGRDLGLAVRYSWEVPVLGSAGGPRHALPLLGAEFLIVNGDTLTNVDLAALVRTHQDTGALVTMAVVPNSEPEKYGGVIVEHDGAVTGFVRRGSAHRSFHFVGVQAVSAAAFAGVPPGVPHESIGALYPSLIATRRGAIRAFQADAEFFDIGTPADYLRTARAIARREGRGTHGARVQLERGAVAEESILWDDVVLEAGAFVRGCVVADGVRVPADTSWHGVVLRKAEGELIPGERRIADLAAAPL